MAEDFFEFICVIVMQYIIVNSNVNIENLKRIGKFSKNWINGFYTNIINSISLLEIAIIVA